MHKQLGRLLLVMQFGRGARRPLRAAACRLALAATSMLGLGWLSATAIAGARLPHDLPLWWVFAVVATAACVLSGLLLLSLGVTTTAARQSALTRIFVVWPLTRLQLWLVQLTPPLVLVGLLLLFALPVTISLALALGVSPFILGGALLFGCGAGLGFGLAHVGQSALLKSLLFAAFIALSLRLLTWSIPGVGFEARLAFLINTALLLAAHAGLVQNYYSAGRLPLSRQRAGPLITLGPSQVYAWWFMAKLLRNPRTRSSLLFCLVLSCCTAAALHVNHAQGDGQGWLLFGAMLAGTFAADIRGLVRRYQPADIVALQGVWFFVLSELQATFGLTLIIGLPLLVAVVPSLSTLPLVSLRYLALQAASATLGLLASTICVPQNGEVGAQFFAAILPVAALFSVVHFCGVGNLGALPQILYWFAVATACLIITYYVEHLRSKHYAHT